MAAGVSNRTYKIIVITPLLATELKATLNDNANNDFFWLQKSSSINVVQCNTTHGPIIFYRRNLCSLTEKCLKAGYVYWSKTLWALLDLNIYLKQIFN